jgi:hypothetical protein
MLMGLKKLGVFLAVVLIAGTSESYSAQNQQPSTTASDKNQKATNRPITVNKVQNPKRYAKGAKGKNREADHNMAWREWLSDNNHWIVIGTLILAIGSIVQIGVSIRTARRQLRAYVLVENGNVWDASAIGEAKQTKRPEIVDIDWDGYVAIEIAIKNSGQTPARDVRHYAQIGIGDEIGGVKYFPLMPESASSDSYASPIGPGGLLFKRLTLTPFPLREPFLSELRGRKKAIFVSGKITYRDAFKTRRVTEYSVFYFGTWPPIPSGRFTFAIKGNRFT